MLARFYGDVIANNDNLNESSTGINEQANLRLSSRKFRFPLHLLSPCRSSRLLLPPRSVVLHNYGPSMHSFSLALYYFPAMSPCHARPSQSPSTHLCPAGSHCLYYHLILPPCLYCCPALVLINLQDIGSCWVKA